MLLSYCYIFSHSPPSACETRSSFRQAFDDQTPSPPQSPAHSEPEKSLLSNITDWSTEAASTFGSAVASSVTSLFDSASVEAVHKGEGLPRPSQASLLPSSVTSWFTSTSDGQPQSQLTPKQATASRLQFHPVKETAQEPVVRTTTFTFCLFGAASTAAVYLLARNRRTMNRLQSAKSMAYRDARAWRRVALDFARINALAASRVQNLVATSLREGRAGGEIGRQIERELEEATRAVAQRRSWIQEQDRKDAETGAASGSQRDFGDVWSDLLDPHHTTGFFFGSRAGRRGSDLGEYGRWKPGVFSRHEDLSSASTDGVAFKPSEPKSPCSPSDAPPKGEPSKRSAQLKWQRVVGHSAAAAPSTVTASSASQSETAASLAKQPAASSQAEADAEAREDWIGDVDRAIRERDLKSSQSVSGADQAAVDAFSRFESEAATEADQISSIRDKEARETAEEDEDHLLPVSELHIATNGQIRDAPEELAHRASTVSKLKRTRIGSVPAQKPVMDADKYAYPISEEFKDLHDIFIAAWDDNFAGLSNAAASQTSSALESDDTRPSVKAKPNRALFEQLRSKKAQSGNVKTESKSTSEADEIEFMAELMFPSAVPVPAPAPASASAPKDPSIPVKASPAKTVASLTAQAQDLTKQLDQKQEELASYKYKMDDLAERLDTMREMCHDLTDEAARREKTHRIQVEQLDHKIGLFTVWAEEVQRRLGLETPPFFASLRKPLKRE